MEQSASDREEGNLFCGDLLHLAIIAVVGCCYRVVVRPRDSQFCLGLILSFIQIPFTYVLHQLALVANERKYFWKF